jgi:hypothetical protein
MSENVGASTFRNPKALQDLYRDKFTFLQVGLEVKFWTYIPWLLGSNLD